jgi:coenzyme F420-reducing hydrogenase alpha subunit
MGAEEPLAEDDPEAGMATVHAAREAVGGLGSELAEARAESVAALAAEVRRIASEARESAERAESLQEQLREAAAARETAER